MEIERHAMENESRNIVFHSAYFDAMVFDTMENNSMENPKIRYSLITPTVRRENLDKKTRNGRKTAGQTHQNQTPDETAKMRR